MTANRKKHWEDIYRSKEFHEFSWYQESPEISLDFIIQNKIPKSARIIEVGGGDSFFVDHLLSMGYQNITVLDISQTAISRAQARLGDQAQDVIWIVADIASFIPTTMYDLWHDRAAFHFLIEDEDIESYISTVQGSLKENGILLLATFAEQGPETCSGVSITRYSETSLAARLRAFFEKIRCIDVDHITPFKTIQKFVYCGFRRKPDELVAAIS
jgi:SAM-dependent methyltransferase